MTETHRGRVVLVDFFTYFTTGDSPVIPVIDARSGRFGGEFFAGAAVAAMGALVFALYLHGWLVERVGRSSARDAGTRPFLAEEACDADGSPEDCRGGKVRGKPAD